MTSYCSYVGTGQTQQTEVYVIAEDAGRAVDFAARRGGFADIKDARQFMRDRPHFRQSYHIFKVTTTVVTSGQVELLD